MDIRTFFIILIYLFSFEAYGQSNNGSFSLYAQFNGPYDFTTIGASLNPQDNITQNCTINNTASAVLNLNPNQSMEAAYLYWSGPGDGSGNTQVQLNGNMVNSQQTLIFTVYPSAPQKVFGCVADVTGIVQTTGNGTYTVTGINLTNVINNSFLQYCTNRLNYGGWAILIVYSTPLSPPKQVNIYNGLKAFGGFTYNFTTTINLNNLNVTNPQDSRIGFLAYNGTANLSSQETVEFNNNILSNPPLNPSDNPFNSTNSFTGSNTLWNMDLDYFDVSNYLAVGDTQASITLNSYDDQPVFQYIVTAIPTELPDASLEILSANFTLPCEGDTLEVTVNLSNTNATAPLPAGMPISFFLDDPLGNPVFSASVSTSQPLPIDGSIPISLSLPVPPEVSGATMLTATANLDEFGQNPISENNLLNNSDSLQIDLPGPPPPAFQPDDLSKCGEVGTTNLDLWNAMANVDITGLETAFYLTLVEAENEQADPIPSPESFAPTNDEQTIFVRLTNDDGCFTIGSFSIELLELPTVDQPSPLVKCEIGLPLGIEEFPIADKIGEIFKHSTASRFGCVVF